MKKPKPPAPSKTPVVPLVAVAAVIVVVAAVWYSRGHDQASATKPAGSAAGTSATSGAPQTTLSVSASPPDAKLFIDDLPLDGNPYKGAFARDGHAHRVRAEAKGFIARTDVVVFDRDEVVTTLSLPQRQRVESIDPDGKPIVARPPGSAAH
jgi:hypothetical protein